MDLGLAGKIVIVTGGSSGIGLATARLFAEEGACVAIIARGEERLREAAEQIATSTGREVYHEVCDVLDAERTNAFVGRVVERFGGVDCLINNAGAGRVSTFATTTDADWRTELELKFFSVVNPTRAVVPAIRARGGGRIVVVNAILARQPEPHMVATSAARAGVLNLTHSLAVELAADNILVNTVALGLIDSEQWRRRHKERAPQLSQAEYYSQVAKDRHVLVQRMGTPEEVAGAIAFLCSSYAGYITGATLDIGGGVQRYV